jgi:DNA polymerase-3 subunit delta'
MSLKEIFCHDRATSIVQRAFGSGKSSHAYIFAGPDGVGKFKTACEWAKMMLCKGPVEENEFADSCGSCDSCRFFEAGSHPDFHHVYKELLEFTKNGKDKTTPVELPIAVIREFLIEKVPNKPTLSQRKVFVVSEAEKLNASSQNALLKVLEEPPGYCSIVLLCTRLERLLATTKSRCQIVRFGLVAEDRIIEKLAGMGLEGVQAQYFARLAQGSMGQACQWARLERAGANLYATKRKMLNSLVDYRYARALKLAEWILSEISRIAAKWANLDKATSKSDIGRRTQKTLVTIVVSALHDAMKFNLGDTGTIINLDQEKQIRSLAESFNVGQSARKIAESYGALHQIESNVNEKLIFERLLLNFVVSDTIKI